MNVSLFGKYVSAILLVTSYCSVLEANDMIRGPAIIELRGALTPVSISSVWHGQVTVRGNSIAPMKFHKGQVKKIWLVSREVVPGIQDPLPTKYVYSRDKKKFLPRLLPSPVMIDSWTIDQKSQEITEVDVSETTILDPITGRMATTKKENPRTWTEYAEVATVFSTVTNETDKELSVKLTLQINLGEGFVNSTTHLSPKEEKQVAVDFPTGGKEITSGLLVDYEIVEKFLPENNAVATKH